MLPRRSIQFLVLLALAGSSLAASPLPPPFPLEELEEPAVESEAEAAGVDSSADQGAIPTAEARGAVELPEEPRREGFLPRLDLFFPEGELDLRVSRLVNKVFFEGQVKYNVLEGDITAFLRYRYYGYRRTLQFTIFDAVEFDDFEELSDEFSRVRGALALFQWPHDYNHRTFVLTEIDRIISNKSELRFSNNRTNTFVRLGYQLGTPRDPRSNALVGESRARVERLFTPFRAIGPRGAGLTTAATYGFDFGPGDFDYVKLEAEGLKRFNMGGRSFLIGRLHLGSIPIADRCIDGEIGTPCESTPGLPEEDRLSVPRSELFRLDGRENLKGLKDPLRGSYELHNTWELFFPGFLDRDFKAFGLEWNNWYWIVYGGFGNIGFDYDIYTQLDDYVADIGVGFETSFRLKKYTFFLSGLVAQSLNGQGEPEAHLSLKSYR